MSLAIFNIYHRVVNYNKFMLCVNNMEKQILLLFAITPILLISFGEVYAINDYVILADDIAIIMENDRFEDALIGDFQVMKTDVIRERHYENDIGIFAKTTTGEYIYLKYDDYTINVKIWTDIGNIVIKTNNHIVPLF